MNKKYMIWQEKDLTYHIVDLDKKYATGLYCNVQDYRILVPDQASVAVESFISSQIFHL